ncbi:MAG: hypothetical protein IT454_02100 [Planctomycetes bacterium]|nr:hypothetical protein [Planctomycetota bacterium]
MSLKNLMGAMNLARWIIVMGGLGAVALGANGWRLYHQRVELEAALEPDGQIERTVQKIQLLGKQCSKLQSDADREGLSGQSEPILYFRGLASDPNVRFGQVEVKEQSPQVNVKGTEDLQYVLQPQVDKGQPRDRIVYYMYLLESKSRRVRVTSITLTPEQKVKEWEIANDMWKWTIELTSRTKVEKK